MLLLSPPLLLPCPLSSSSSSSRCLCPVFLLFSHPFCPSFEVCVRGCVSALPSLFSNQMTCLLYLLKECAPLSILLRLGRLLSVCSSANPLVQVYERQCMSYNAFSICFVFTFTVASHFPHLPHFRLPLLPHACSPSLTPS